MGWASEDARKEKAYEGEDRHGQEEVFSVPLKMSKPKQKNVPYNVWN